VLLKSLLVVAVLLLTNVCRAAVTVGDLRCEYRVNPLGIDVEKPRLSWILTSAQRGEMQKAFQVLVASTPEVLAQDRGDLWDGGKVPSNQSVNVEYAGTALTTGQQCFWKVRVWDKNDQASAWSTPASWSMGMLKDGDWQAKWIGYDAAYAQLAANRDTQLLSTQGLRWVHLAAAKAKAGVFSMYLRKMVDLPADRPVRRATVVLYADNECRVRVNGQEVGTAVRWESTAHIDVTKALAAGPNVLALTAQNSDYLPATVVGKVVVQFADGADLQVPFDGTAKVSAEAADGWDKPGFDDQAWTSAETSDGTPWGTPGLHDNPRLPAPYLRKDFSVGAEKPIKRATVYVTALGAYELHLNGHRVGQDVLAPGWTEFRKRVHYQTYDVTGQVAAGKNVLGALLGDGWYASTLAFTGKRNYYGGHPRLLVQLVVEAADGTTQTVVSDGTWKAAYGPIDYAELLVGCSFDARRKMPGWDAAGFDDQAWVPVVEGLGGAAGSADVTALLAAAIKDGHLTLPVENDALGGDPAKDVVKALHVQYRLDGKEETKVVAEKQSLNLAAGAGQKLEIVHATYGPAQAVAAAPLQVQASVVEPARPIEEIPAVKITEPKPGQYTFDLGQNMVGWVRLKVRGTAGQRISLRHGEMLNPDHTLYTTNLRGANSTDTFVLSGQGEEVFEPYFTFHGFRYVEIRGLTQKPALDAVTGIVVHTPLRRTGQFECSSTLVNQLYHNIIWGQKGNYMEVPTDCPQRDERAGWTGDTQFFIPTAAYNFDIAPFFTRWLTTICEDSQHADGSVAHVSPDLGLGSGSTAWGDAALICTYNIFRTYGDTRVVAAHFPALDRLMGWYTARSVNFVPKTNGFGDWLNLGGSASADVMDTAYYAYMAGLMAEMAQAIGRTDDAQRYDKLHDDVKAAFAKFFGPDGALKDSSQTGYALAFSMNLVPDDLRQKAAGKYAEEIKRFDWHLATGFIGTPRLLPGLHAAGQDATAYRLLLQETYPSWLFQVKLGATTMWERWDGWTPDRGFQSIGMNSFNHYAFGAVGEFLYSAVGGISPAIPGYGKIRIAPIPGSGLTWANTSFDCPYGKIVSNWKHDGDKLTMDVTVPANTAATIHVPAANAAAVREGDGPAAQAAGVKALGLQDGAAVFEVGAGTYHFASEMKAE